MRDEGMLLHPCPTCGQTRFIKQRKDTMVEFIRRVKARGGKWAIQDIIWDESFFDLWPLGRKREVAIRSLARNMKRKGLAESTGRGEYQLKGEQE